MKSSTISMSDEAWANKFAPAILRARAIPTQQDEDGNEVPEYTEGQWLARIVKKIQIAALMKVYYEGEELLEQDEEGKEDGFIT